MYFNITWKFVEDEWKIQNVAERKCERRNEE